MIIGTANKIINKQEYYVRFFLQIVMIYARKRWRQVGIPCISHSREKVNFDGLLVPLKIEQHKYTRKFLQ